MDLYVAWPEVVDAGALPDDFVFPKPVISSSRETAASEARELSRIPGIKGILLAPIKAFEDGEEVSCPS